MDTLPPGPLILSLLLIVAFSAIITIAETATVAISDARLKKLAEDGDRRAVRLFKLLDENPSEFMDAMQFSTNFFGFLASSVASIGFVHTLVVFVESYGVSVPDGLLKSIVILSITLALIYFYLVFSVFIPRRVARRNAEKIALNFSGFTCFISKILIPFVWLPGATAAGILRIFGIAPHNDDDDVTEEEIRMMVDIGSETGAIDDDEKKMIHNIFELDDKPVEDIMTHRTDIDILWLNDNIEKWTEFINETNHTRYPVCGNSIDDIVGVLNSRDFYKMLLCDKEPDLIGILRQPYFIPESIKADDLFSQMQNENTHFAIVLDEYGGFMGIVTQEDLLEEIVGELYSEYDEPEDMEEIVEIGEGAWKIQGSTELEAVSEALDIDICSDEYNTFAGMILDELGTIPEDGAVIELKVKNMEIKVTKIEEHRIEEAVVHLLEKPEDEPDDDED